MTDSAPVPEQAVTPVGDWLRRRYPPNDGATHWLGRDGDPGCCAGPHPMCTYDVAFREGAVAERERQAALLAAYRNLYELWQTRVATVRAMDEAAEAIGQLLSETQVTAPQPERQAVRLKDGD